MSLGRGEGWFSSIITTRYGIEPLQMDLEAGGDSYFLEAASLPLWNHKLMGPLSEEKPSAQWLDIIAEEDNE